MTDGEHATNSDGAPLYVAYQKPVEISGKEVLARTFEDALILANFESEFFQAKEKIKDAKADHEEGIKSLEESLYDYVKTLKKGDFAFNCLLHIAAEQNNKFDPPEYMHKGLKWLEDQLKPAAKAET